MPSFDVVNEVDMQEITNTVMNASKEVAQRYDFRGSNTTIDLDSDAGQIVIRCEDEMKIEAVKEVLLTHAVRRKVDAGCLEFKEPEAAGGKTMRQEVQIHQGIDREIAQKIVKDVKARKMKVQVAIQGEELRVTGKKRDDLQGVISFLKSEDYGIPLQFVNMRD
ncbi:MAG TPA: YajQ family cyclic di-GMP-binding protein [Candidatus Latescibacteria bacterium]|nr:YajQ family cyclic di-GMP-binding protein [Candidatus Latescibacterota bacterium]|tara:strand:+ start:411 stop:902 length:492 start_codon:yes stop_codon:yes gene_type:complete